MDFEVHRRTVMQTTVYAPCMRRGRGLRNMTTASFGREKREKVEEPWMLGPPSPLAADGEDWDGTSRGMTGMRIDDDDDFDFCIRVFISKRLTVLGSMVLGGVVRYQGKKHGTLD